MASIKHWNAKKCSHLPGSLERLTVAFALENARVFAIKENILCLASFRAGHLKLEVGHESVTFFMLQNGIKMTFEVKYQ